MTVVDILDEFTSSLHHQITGADKLVKPTTARVQMVTGFLNHTLLPERSHGYEVTMTFISTGKGFILLEAQENKDWNPGVMQALPEGAMEGGGETK